MSWSNNYNSLIYLLADLYDDKEEARALVKRAGLKAGHISFKDQAYTNWFNIIEGADRQGKVMALTDTIMMPDEKGGSADPSLRQIIVGIVNNIAENQIPAKNSNLVDKVIQQEPLGNLEKIMGNKSTLLPIGFLEEGLKCSKAVVRLKVGKFLGTGFLIGDNWIITNHHVIPDEEAVAEAIVQFNFQKDAAGRDAEIDKYKFQTGQGNFYTSEADDWSFIRLDRDANGTYGALILADKEIVEEDFVNIIQHPEGLPKQIALYHNTVTSVTDKYVMYLTDTLPGSSGSPVFNTEWKVVALHHWGGNTRERYSLFNVYRNRGINITRIKNALTDLKIVK